MPSKSPKRKVHRDHDGRAYMVTTVEKFETKEYVGVHLTFQKGEALKEYYSQAHRGS